MSTDTLVQNVLLVLWFLPLFHWHQISLWNHHLRRCQTVVTIAVRIRKLSVH